jgi:SAM-dependent methyltransferase
MTGTGGGGFEAVHYGPDLPGERELRLLGDVRGKRLLDLGCGTGQAAIAVARQGAHAIAIDLSTDRMAEGRKHAQAEEVRVEWHPGDLADLAFLRADSIDLAMSFGALDEVDDLDRVLRQVHRVLRPGGAFVFSYAHPVALCTARDDGPDGALPLGRLEWRRSYFDRGAVTIERDGDKVTLYPRTIAEVFAAAGRAGFRVDVIIEPEARTADPGPAFPTAIVWRARKESS